MQMVINYNGFKANKEEVMDFLLGFKLERLQEDSVLFYAGASSKDNDFFDFEVSKVIDNTIHLVAVPEEKHAYDE